MDFEKLGLLYLGRPYDLGAKQPKPGLLLYDSKDLVTHAVCVGMTGSGKTGLCLCLIEEAAIDGVPALVIDPKGDLSNLLLTFPDLRAEDFAPWINEDDARRKDVAPAEYAAQQAALWRAGLSEWGQNGARIRRLCHSADFAVYTPGSEAGLPISILKSFAAPPAAILEEAELLRERVATTATSLLGLLGIEADPIRSREHILLSILLEQAWRGERDLDLPSLIAQIQTPPVPRVGVLDLETFYPGTDRFALAMALNNLLAAPGFGAWMEGEALDIDRLLHTPEGKPRVSIFSIAHLSDAERMFFVSLLLNQTLGWMRTQAGTTSLRALVYMDEIFGYFPPVANPPSKGPLLTLLKQARAYGVGIVLATQNPVDLDYKGLANTGTWFIGRLQTERDKARVLEGLEGVAATSSTPFARARVEETLAGLGKRIFLMHNVHEDGPEVFETRWALSYLRGPLARAEIKRLMSDRKAALASSSSTEVRTTPSAVRAGSARVVAASAVPPVGSERPVLPPEIAQHFIPLRGAPPSASELVYAPMMFGSAQIRFADAKTNVEVSRGVAVAAPVTDAALAVNWQDAIDVGVGASDLEREPASGARYLRLAAAAAKAKNYEAWRKAFAAWLYGSQKLELLNSQSLKIVSTPGEGERDFRIRLQQAMRERRDRALDELRQKYAPKITAAQERVRRAQQVVERESEQASQQKAQTAISFGATLLAAVLGRKVLGTSTLGRATTAARGVGRAMKEAQDITRAKGTLDATEAQLHDLESRFSEEAAALEASLDPSTVTLDRIVLALKKTNIVVQLVTLVWMPFWEDAAGARTEAY